MPVSVMDVGIVRVRVHHRLMPVPVAVRLSLCIIGVMLVQMVLVVAV
ncbi:MAG: hypothetical protein H0W30_17735 [Gemmatimonadaceae bacterium]|nr:hypothetical protein [Gemmatimonadaceae bacterium]